MARKGNLVMTKTVTKVQLLDDVFSGTGAYKTDDLSKDVLECFGYEYVDYGDGSGTACLLVMNDTGAVVARAMDRFKLIDWTDEKP